MKYSDRLVDDNVTIFLLHGVIQQQIHRVRNYTKKHITVDFCEKFLTDLSVNGTPLSMDDVIYHVNNRKSYPKKSFVITFDDGFENNYSIACPLLRNFNIPATFYVTTDFIDNNRMSWIDRIEYVIEISDFGTVLVQSETWSFDHTINSKMEFLDNVRKKLKSQKRIRSRSDCHRHSKTTGI